MTIPSEESTLRRWIGRIAVTALFVGALFVLRTLLHHYHYHEIAHEIRRIPTHKLLWAGFFCILNYIVLTFYDTLANIYVERDLPYRRTALTAFISYTFSQNLGFALLSGGAVRYRLYTAWGYSSAEVAKIIAFAGFNFWLGLLLLVGVLCISDPHMILNVGHMHGVSTSYAIGAACLSAVAFYLWSCSRGGRVMQMGGWEIPLPGIGLALAAMTVACLDWLLASATLFALLPSSVAFVDFASAYFASQAVGIVSHVPGGLGVFEALMVMVFSSSMSGQKLVGALIVYRLIYYIIPFLGGAAALVLYELRRRGAGQHLRQANAQVERVLRSVVPPLLSVVVFVAGIVLLASGATPAQHERLSWLSLFVPLPLLEFSHLMNSVIGLILLFLAWSIQKRINSAYLLTLVTLFAGAIVSLGKGYDFEEALWMIITLIVFLPCRRYFYRSAFLFSGFSWVMFGAILSVVVGVTWLGFFSFKHITYSDSLWWQFTFEGDAPRFLRASVGVCLVFLCAGLWWLFRPARVLSEHLPDLFEIEAAKKILQRASTTLPFLALSGDKSLLFNESRSAFLMYRRSGRSYIALGEPVGPAEDCKELIWQFRDLCDKSDSYCVFYQISGIALPAYLDLGLLPHKLGEEGLVDISAFSLEGGGAKGLRRTLSKPEKEGFTFVIHPASEVPALLPQLRKVSDAWLAKRNTREKGFSIGRFDEIYLSQLPVATVQKGSDIVAFSNVLCTEDRKELTTDLMRYSDDAPDSAMEYLFLKLILWGKEQGYQTFNLGMTPLAGFESRRLSTLWNRAGALLYDKGEFFYNFEGLRKFKEKFHPSWEPRYLMCPGGLALPRVLAAVTTLIADGWRGVFSK